MALATPTKPTTSPLLGYLHDLAAVAHEAAKEIGLPPTWCISAAGLTRHLLTSEGYGGIRLLGVDVVGFNSTAWDLYRRGVPVGAWPSDARGFGISGTGATGADGWDGHAVAYVPARVASGQAWIVDLSAPQFSDPQIGITVPPLVLPVSATFLAGDPQAYELPGIQLTLARNPKLTASIEQQVARAGHFLQDLADVTQRHLDARRRSSARADRRQASWHPGSTFSGNHGLAPIRGLGLNAPRTVATR